MGSPSIRKSHVNLGLIKVTKLILYVRFSKSPDLQESWIEQGKNNVQLIQHQTCTCAERMSCILQVMFKYMDT